MTVGKLAERSRQPFLLIYGIELAALEKGGNHRPLVATLVRAGEQGILAIDGKGPDAALDWIAVEVDASIIDE